MPRQRLVECVFLIPVRRDADLSDGELHAAGAWYWLDDRLHELFGGRTRAPGLYEGLYTDPDTKVRVVDRSRKYIAAVPEKGIDRLRSLLAEACVRFCQKCIYLSVAGQVEFIEGPRHETK